MDKSIIKVRSMSFKYADKYIFKDFDMDIDTNSFVCIIGRNASGKSTLVKILGGLCKASGYINVDGYLLNDTYIKKIIRSLAICFDDADRHFIGDTVFDDLAFSLENLGYFPKEIENMVNNIVKDKLNSDQLNECDLTFRDLEIIKGCFLKVLKGIYHHRIEYPKEKGKE